VTRLPVYLALAGLVAACDADSPVPPPVGRFADLPPDQVASKLASGCSASGLMVQASPTSVVCSKRAMDMPGGDAQAVMAQVLVGNAYSTPVVYKVTFTLWPDGQGTRVQAYQVAETQMPYGQVSQVPIMGAAQTRRIQVFLRSLGAT